MRRVIKNIDDEGMGLFMRHVRHVSTASYSGMLRVSYDKVKTNVDGEQSYLVNFVCPSSIGRSPPVFNTIIKMLKHTHPDVEVKK